jgi:hypothetical protein
MVALRCRRLQGWKELEPRTREILPRARALNPASLMDGALGWSPCKELLEGSLGSRLGSMMLQHHGAAASASFLFLSLDSLSLECVGVRGVWAHVPVGGGGCRRRRASCVSCLQAHVACHACWPFRHETRMRDACVSAV